MRKNNKYCVEDIKTLHGQLVVLMKDLETNEYFEITEDTLKNKESKTDRIIYSIVMEHFYNYLLYNNLKEECIKNATK